MKYFRTLPKLNKIDERGNVILATNLLARASIIEKLLKNPLIFYSYDIQESDTPEILAHKYYGDIERFWLILFANQLLDPQWDWPLNSINFQKYLNDKYTTEQLAQAHHYEKIITTTDRASKTKTEHKIIIDEETYDTFINSENGYALPNGTIVIVEEQKNIVSNFEYELQLNESKRNIKLLNKTYAEQIESEFVRLMS
jgi:hypothetical protein